MTGTLKDEEEFNLVFNLVQIRKGMFKCPCRTFSPSEVETSGQSAIITVILI
jgi:hypothetical protein